MNVKRYSIDYHKFAVQRIPVRIRFDDVKAFVIQLVTPVVNIYNSLLLFRDQVSYKLTITPQVVHLEKMLNDRYDSELRRIYIADGKTYDPLYLYRKAEEKPLHIYRKSEAAKPRVYLYTKGESSNLTFDFVVMIPTDLVYNANELKSLVNTYKLAGKLFTTQTF